MDDLPLRCLLAGLLGIAACAAPIPEAEALDSIDAVAAVGGYAIVPDTRPRAEALEQESPEPHVGKPAPGPAPQLHVVQADDARCTLEGPCSWPTLCPFAVLGQGLPALRSDETAVAHLVHAPIPYDDVELVIDALDDGRRQTEPVFDESPLGELAEAELPGACDEARARLEARVTTINAELARYDWRPMTRLPVEVIPGPDTAADGFEGPDERPVAERPVQVRLRNGQYVVRVPGVRVLHRIAWAHGPNIDLGPVWADESSGIALLGYMNTNEVCSASLPESVDARSAHLPEEVFAAARTRAAHAHAW